jgi:CRISPR-associated protein (TIGR03985 family)
MKFPSINNLEELYPDLVRFAAFPQSDLKTQQRFIQAMNTAARLWTIKQSLYESDSDIYVEITEQSFKCATWEKMFIDVVPDYRQRTLEAFLLAEHSINEQYAWKDAVLKRYKIEQSLLRELLTSSIFAVDSRTLRNHFKRLAKLKTPVLLELTQPRGEYQKLSAATIDDYEAKVSNILEQTNSDALNIINAGLYTIAELLLNKINGEQRLFIHTEYIVNRELQDLADDWANSLTEIWRQAEIPPITIEYDSASYQTIGNYLVYPVCLFYYQRAFYLTAFGQSPNHLNPEFAWYNYRLERIKDLYPESWSDSEIAQKLKIITHQNATVRPKYTPENIQFELDLAYGFDFYRDRATMLLRFNRDFSDRYIQDTERHATFKQVDLKTAKNLLQQQLKLESSQLEQLIKILNRHPEDHLYQLDYRVGDNTVIMRLRAWGPNVEVIYPWSLRQRMKEDMEQTWRLYESDR